MQASPAALTPASEAGPSASVTSTPATTFSSNWNAFGLAQPRSNLTMQLEAMPLEQQTSLSMFQRRANPAAASTTGTGPFGTASSGSLRRQSMLGLDAAMTEDGQDEHDDGFSQMSTSLSRDVAMSASFDPTLPSSAFTMSSRSARSRSASESASIHPFQAPHPPTLFGNVPPSPITVARALQAGQKTPPAMFQRRLFKDDQHMVDGDGSNSEARSSRSGSSSDVGAGSTPHFSTRDKGKRRATLSEMIQDEDNEIEELSMGLSRSTSGSAQENEFDSSRVVRRPVSRKPNLLPKPKSHLRVLSDLKSESAPGGDLAAEIASEATLHRLSRSGASTVPPLRPASLSGGSNSHHHHHHFSHNDPTTAYSSLPAGGAGAGGAGILSTSRPTPNRFPETIEDDDALLGSTISEPSSSDEDRDLDDNLGDPDNGGAVLTDLEIGSDWGGASTNGGYETGPEDGPGNALEEARKMQIVWNGIRSGGGSKMTTTAFNPSPAVYSTPSFSMAKSPGSGSSRGGMDVENPFNTPQTPSSTFSSRPGKRKNIEDTRFEPYSHAFKRRAVSPAASSLSLSPGFGSLNTTTNIPPLHTNASSLPVSIPSPTLSTTAISCQHGASGTRSLAGSPIGSSLSTGFGGLSTGFGTLKTSNTSANRDAGVLGRRGSGGAK
ncbi:uncharacterized protein JCM15063_004878 [Sporobolomyces koalae]|uniref:uncharacterized protein n=1 Tax=Sporobolomyces koalae TaxID=500713 RepID=UPI00316BA2BA